MNVRMWVKALQVIPRINKDEWDGLDFISRWLISTRAAVLVMTFISAGIAGLQALRAGQFDGLLQLRRFRRAPLALVVLTPADVQLGRDDERKHHGVRAGRCAEGR